MGEEVVVSVPNTPIPAAAPVGRSRVLFLFALPILLMAGTWGAGVWIYSKLATDPETPPVAPSNNGEALFAQNCAYCHGVQGNGRGVAALSPPARYFGKEEFRFTTTTLLDAEGKISKGGIPSDSDLLRTIRNGLPGSSMPAFEHLSDADRQALVGHVRKLVITGIYERIRQKSDPDEFDSAAAWRLATQQAEIGKPLTLTVRGGPSSPNDLERGKALFLTNCANCHGKEGRGDGEQTKDPKFVTDNGSRAMPRDLTQGIFKAGRSYEDVYARILLGIPGTPMPATTKLKDEEMQALIDYVLSLSQKSFAATSSNPSVAVK